MCNVNNRNTVFNQTLIGVPASPWWPRYRKRCFRGTVGLHRCLSMRHFCFRWTTNHVLLARKLHGECEFQPSKYLLAQWNNAKTLFLETLQLHYFVVTCKIGGFYHFTILFGNTPPRGLPRWPVGKQGLKHTLDTMLCPLGLAIQVTWVALASFLIFPCLSLLFSYLGII